MKKIFLFISLLALASCYDRIRPSGNVVSLSSDPGDFTALEIHSAINATVTMTGKGEEPSLVIVADDNILPHIETYKEGETLIVRVQKNLSLKGNNATLKASVKAVRLTGIEGHGASVISFPDGITTNDLEVELNGASQFKGNVAAKNLNVELSGASMWKGDITAVTLNADLDGASVFRTNGFAEQITLECDGASDFNWNDYVFTASVVKAGIHGASNAKLTVNTSLEVKAEGASKFYYKGDPDPCKISGSDITSVVQKVE